MPLPPGTPPPVGPRGLALRCAIQGRDAYARGAPLNACPYGPGRPFSRRAWVVGYNAGARAAGARLPGDTECDEDAPWPGDVDASPRHGR